MKQLLTLIASIMSGVFILRIDYHPNWDDTGITAGMILVATGVISFVNPRRPFICAISTSIWIPLFGIINDNNYGTLLVFVFGFVGAYLGSMLRKFLTISF